MTSTILVTGGAGYIGSHTLVELATAGYVEDYTVGFCTLSASEWQ